MNTTALRAFVGFLVAPAVPALIMYLVQLIFVRRGEAEWAAIAIGLFGYLTTVVVGIPAYFFLQRKAVTGLGVYLVLGALIGLTCYALLFIPGALLNWKANAEGAYLMLRNSAGLAVLAIVCGLIASLVFWLIAINAVRRNP
jgi:hypothetical protein